FRRLSGGPAGAGHLAARARPFGRGAEAARGPARRLRALSRVRSLDPGVVRAAPRHADRLHVRLDRAALDRPVVPPGLPDVPKSTVRESGVGGVGADAGAPRLPGPLPPRASTYLP